MNPARSMWEQRYGGDDYAYGTEPNGFLAERAHLLTGPVMCLAEGEGRNAVHLAGLGLEVHSVDLAAAGVAKTLRLATSRGVAVHATQGDLAHYDLGVERWGSLVSIFAHMPPAVRADLHRRVVAALRPGGVLVLEAYTPAQVGRGTGGPDVPEMTMSLGLLHGELQGLQFEYAAEVEREVVEGALHTGTAAVVQLVARKPA